MVTSKELADPSAAVYTDYTSVDVGRTIAQNSNWTLVRAFPDPDTGFYGAVYRNAQGEMVAAIRGMELLLQDVGTVAQVKLGLCGYVRHS
ncbi:MAG: hypothetical protein H8K04_06550 [Nitrospira sp.]